MKENSAAVHVQVPVDVATFLLNEKRVDIASVESRLKVNVILIPNIHLETPNYKITRLRHDDLNQEGIQPASYNMVDVPDDADHALAAAQEPKLAKPQAAVQNVTPEQPAPAPVAKPEAAPAPTAPQSTDGSGIIGRILGWFRAPAPTAAAREDAAASHSPRREGGQRDRDNNEARPRGQPRGGRGGERQDRGEARSGQRGERNRQGQQSRGDRPDRGPKPDGAPRQADKPREERPDRGPRPENAQSGTPRPEGRPDGRRDGRNSRRRDGEPREGEHQDVERHRQQEQGATQGNSEQSIDSEQSADQRPPRPEGERGGRRRGGRNRNRDGRPSTDRLANMDDIEGQTASLPPPISVADAMAPVAERIDTQNNVAQVATASVEAASSAVSPSQASTVNISPEAPASALNAATVDVVPPVVVEKLTAVTPAVNKVELGQVLQASGLQLVETRVKADTATEPAFVPAKRERRPPPSSMSESLVQVETDGKREGQTPA